MPLPRKKIKLVKCGATGRSQTKWIKSKPKESDRGKGTKDLTVPKRASLIDIGEFEVPEGPRVVENSKQYAELKKKDIESWASLRDELLRTAVKRNVPSVDFCLKCGRNGLGQAGETDGEDTQDMIFRCEDCGPFYFVCYSCLLDDHNLRPNHIPDGWNVCY